MSQRRLITRRRQHDKRTRGGGGATTGVMGQPAGEQEVEVKLQGRGGGGATGAMRQPVGKQEAEANAVCHKMEAAPQEDKKRWWHNNWDDGATSWQTRGKREGRHQQTSEVAERG